MANLRSVPCTNCGSERDEDTKIPCKLCGSRQHWLLGYTYQHEIQPVRWMIILFSIFCFILLLAGVGYILYF